MFYDENESIEGYHDMIKKHRKWTQIQTNPVWGSERKERERKTGADARYNSSSTRRGSCVGATPGVLDSAPLAAWLRLCRRSARLDGYQDPDGVSRSFRPKTDPHVSERRPPPGED